MVNLDIDTKRNILCCIIEKLNSDSLRTILKFCNDEKITITYTNKFAMFDIFKLTDLQIKHLWILIMN